MNMPLLGSPEFFAQCAEADRTITAGDSKKIHLPRSKPRKPPVERPKVYPPAIKNRAIALKTAYPLKSKTEISAQIYRETKIYVEPNLISQWMAAHKNGAKNVAKKT